MFAIPERQFRNVFLFELSRLFQFIAYIIKLLRVFENRILRLIFEPKRDSNGEWRRLHDEELDSLFRSPNMQDM